LVTLCWQTPLTGQLPLRGEQQQMMKVIWQSLLLQGIASDRCVGVCKQCCTETVSAMHALPASLLQQLARVLV
jgi:hypothetical protein